MKNAQQIRELIAEKRAEAEAIVALAESEKRELTSDESAAFDKIMGAAAHGTASAIAGEIEQLEIELARAEKRDKLKADLLGKKIESGEVSLDSNRSIDTDNILDRIRVPATARSRTKLKCFEGNEGEKAAFMTGHYLAATLGDSKRSQEWLDQNGIEIRNAMTESDSTRGGVFVPVETELAIIRQVETHGVFRGEAQTSNMTSDRKVATVRVSGVKAYPVGETEAGTESEPTYKQVELIARKWKTMAKMSDDLNEDTLVSLADQFVLESGLAFAYSEDDAGFNGNGTSAYHRITGVMNALNAGSIHLAAAGNLKFSDLEMADYLGMVGKLPDFAGIMPKWYISKEGYYASMAPLKLAAGGNAVAEVTGGANQREFLGYPVVFVKVMNKNLANQASKRLLLFGDISMAAMFGDRRGITFDVNDRLYWNTDQIGIKATSRFDINVFSRGTASEAGPLLALETPAS